MRLVRSKAAAGVIAQTDDLLSRLDAWLQSETKDESELRALLSETRALATDDPVAQLMNALPPERWNEIDDAIPPQ